MYQKEKHTNGYYNGRHSCFLLQYHIVLITKFRHPVIIGELQKDLYQLIREQVEDREYVLLELNGEPDHVHILLEADPYFCPGEFINNLKTRTFRLIRKDYGDTVLKPYYWKPFFWSNTYFVATVSEQSLAAVEDYIRNQGR